MGVVVNYNDDIALHDDADGWYYMQVEDTTIAVLTDGDENNIGVDVFVENINQIQHLDDEETAELAEYLG